MKITILFQCLLSICVGCVIEKTDPNIQESTALGDTYTSAFCFPWNTDTDRKPGFSCKCQFHLSYYVIPIIGWDCSQSVPTPAPCTYSAPAPLSAPTPPFAPTPPLAPAPPLAPVPPLAPAPPLASAVDLVPTPPPVPPRIPTPIPRPKSISHHKIKRIKYTLQIDF